MLSSEDFIKTWNICLRDNEHKELQHRTNDALERHNRCLNDLFGSPHPSLLFFVTAIEKEAREKVQQVENIKHGHEESPDLQEVHTNKTPDEHMNFVA